MTEMTGVSDEARPKKSPEEIAFEHRVLDVLNPALAAWWSARPARVLPKTTSTTQKWLVGVLTTLVLLIGGASLADLRGQIAEVKGEQSTDRRERERTSRDVEVIKEKVSRLDEAQREMKQEQREMKQEQGRKLDEIRDLLRRAR